MNDINERLYGIDLFGDTIKPASAGPVAERFLFPPFSVLDARQGEWQERKRAWAGMGIRGEIGRGATTYNTQGTLNMGGHAGTLRRGNTGIEWGEEYNGGDCWSGSDTSIFDPVLCELIYRWFCPERGQVVDPFAGGSVRGIVASALGLKYWGCDLSAQQIAANEEQADEIMPDVRPVWITGDSMDALESAPAADLIFSCPPYGDLEKYSDDPRDLSAMEWHTFTAAYKRIILRACSRLKSNRFACFVVGDFRDPRGHYRDFVSTTIAGFKECGLHLYNEAILITSVGSAAMRVTKQFDSGRKLCKTHQNVLVFVKGDWRAAAKECRLTQPEQQILS